MQFKEQKFTDVPLFELTSFTTYEIDKIGLITLMLGDNAIRYEDRYVVKNINYTDNSKKYIANMKSNNGIYKEDVVTLRGDVIYSREDGLTFETDQAVYDKKTSVATTDDVYVAVQNFNTINGSSLEYNNDLKKIESKNVIVKYQLKEKQ